MPTSHPCPLPILPKRPAYDVLRALEGPLQRVISLVDCRGLLVRKGALLGRCGGKLVGVEESLQLLVVAL